MRKYVIAKYIRLSLDDAQSDSMSIENQRLLIEHHIASLDTDAELEVHEFVDNGWSGTNYERPAVQKLLGLVRESKIDCIIVKDFSRFGRNALETGYFIEQVFPLFRVRFISVSDGFDSDEHLGDTGGMEVAFKFLMHEYYSQDLSRKIKSARHAKMRRGESVTKNCVFGYVKVGKRLETDENAAETVRRIFDLAADGVGVTDIMHLLHDEKRPTPSEYKKHIQNPRCIWESSVIRSMLRDERYIGTYISGKSEILSVGSHRVSKKDASEWIRIPNHHPAIVSAAVFNKVQRILGEKTHYDSRVRQSRDYLLKSKAYCGVCAHALGRSSAKNAAFFCRHTRVDIDAECHGLSIRERELENSLYGMIRERSQVILDISMARSTETNDCSGGLRDEKSNLYERYITGEIDAARYRTECAKLDAAASRLNREADSRVADDVRGIAETAVNAGALTREVVDALIERVRVYPSDRVEIEWKFADFTKNMI
ncbi:MAG: recombinase family protein [Oscillospiraceae bacterium]|nr:recombinase family protein [Oscillospiraceae bacterium]